jgi:hypothetical protein
MSYSDIAAVLRQGGGKAPAYTALEAYLTSASGGASRITRSTWCAVVRAHLVTVNTALAASTVLPTFCSRIFDVLGPSARDGTVAVFSLRCALIAMLALEPFAAAEALFEAACDGKPVAKTIATRRGISAIVLTNMMIQHEEYAPAEHRDSVDASEALSAVFNACVRAARACNSAVFNGWNRQHVSVEQFAAPSCGVRIHLAQLLAGLALPSRESNREMGLVEAAEASRPRPLAPATLSGRDAAAIDESMFKHEDAGPQTEPRRLAALAATLARLDVEQLCDIVRERATVKRAGFIEGVLDCTSVTPSDGARSGLERVVGAAFDAFCTNGNGTFRLHDATIGMGIFTIGSCDANPEALAEVVSYAFDALASDGSLDFDGLAAFFENVLIMGRATGVVPAGLAPQRGLAAVAHQLARACFDDDFSARSCGGVSEKHLCAWLARIAGSAWVALPPSTPNDDSRAGNARSLGNELQRCGFNLARRVIAQMPSLDELELARAFVDLTDGEASRNASAAAELASYLIERCDANGDNLVDLRELVTGIARLGSENSDIIEVRRVCRALFRIYDESNDGYLAAAEVEELLINTLEETVFAEITSRNGGGRNVALYANARAEAQLLVEAMISSGPKREAIAERHGVHASRSSTVSYQEFEEWYMTRANGGGADWRFQASKVAVSRLTVLVATCYTVGDIEAIVPQALPYIPTDARRAFTPEVMVVLLNREAPWITPRHAAQLNVDIAGFYTAASFSRISDRAWAAMTPAVRHVAERVLVDSSVWATALTAENAFSVTESDILSISTDALINITFEAAAKFTLSVRTAFVTRCLAERAALMNGDLGSHAHALSNDAFCNRVDDTASNLLNVELVACVDDEVIGSLPARVLAGLDMETAAACAARFEAFDALHATQRNELHASCAPVLTALLTRARALFSKMDWTSVGALTIEALQNPHADRMIREMCAHLENELVVKSPAGGVQSAQFSMPVHPAGFASLFDSVTAPERIVVAHAFEIALLTCCVPPLDSWTALAVVDSNAEAALEHLSSFRECCAQTFNTVCGPNEELTALALFKQRHVLRNPALALGAEPAGIVELLMEAASGKENAPPSSVVITFDIFERLLVRRARW